MLRRHLNKIVRDEGGDLVPLSDSQHGPHGELETAVPKAWSRIGEILLEVENGSWPAMGLVIPRFPNLERSSMRWVIPTHTQD